MSDLRYALRSIRRMPGLAAVVIALARHRHRRQHGRVLVDATARLQPASGREGRRQPPADRTPHRQRWLPRHLVAGSARSARTPAVVPRPVRLAHHPFQRRRSQPRRAHVRTVRVRQLLRRTRREARLRPSARAGRSARGSAASRSWSSRTDSGNRSWHARRTRSDRRCASTISRSRSSASRRRGFRARRSACSSMSGCRRRSRRC